MKIKECAYYTEETLIGTLSNGTCNLFPKYEILKYKFIDCEIIPISKCPYKLFKTGKIDKEQLNKLIQEKLRKDS